MTSYTEMIAGTHLVRKIELTTTTGDLDYEGTALEIEDEEGNELFHVVVDEKGERQFLLFRSEGNIRIPLSIIEEVVGAAKEKVHSVGL